MPNSPFGDPAKMRTQIAKYKTVLGETDSDDKDFILMRKFTEFKEDFRPRHPNDRRKVARDYNNKPRNYTTQYRG